MRTNDRRLKIVFLSHEALLGILNGEAQICGPGIPPDARVVGVRENFARCGLSVLVQSDGFPDVPEGNMIPDEPGLAACRPPAIPARVPFNINMPVRVRLTELGRRIHCEYYSFGSAPRRNEEGWTKYQFHQLMGIFGPHMGACAPLAFETNVEICPEG